MTSELPKHPDNQVDSSLGSKSEVPTKLQPVFDKIITAFSFGDLEPKGLELIQEWLEAEFWGRSDDYGPDPETALNL